MLYATAGPPVPTPPSAPTGNLRLVARPLATPPVPVLPPPVVGRIAVSSQRPEGAAAVLTVAALLADLPGHNTIDMGAWLGDLCRKLDTTFGRPGGPSLSCSTSAHLLPMGQAITLGLIVDLLVSNAYVHGFPSGTGGRITVSLIGLEALFELTIDDSGQVGRGAAQGRAHGLTLASRLVRQLGGWLELRKVVGGRRYIISVPRYTNLHLR